ncbi:MAG TPA: DUF5658 family protein, partial [Gemmataceae bacterium]|nr:DUF5658 family protein [Gemmataceae bacterium]
WLFALMNLSDLALTLFLLNRNGGAYESNPVAAWCLQRFGWPGLVAFKLSVAALAALAVVLIARRSLLAAGSVLTFACAALLGVLVYSSLLVPEVCAEGKSREELSNHKEQLEAHLSRYREYQSLLDRLANQLTADRCSLDAAVKALCKSDRVHDPLWVESLSQRFPGYRVPELIAIRLMLEVMESPDLTPDQVAKRIGDLCVQFQARFHRPAPVEFDDVQKSM